MLTRRTFQFELLRSGFAATLLLAAQAAVAQGFTATPERQFDLDRSDLPLRIPTAVAVGPDGVVYVLDGAHNRVALFEADGRRRAAWTRFGETALAQPVGLHLDAQRRLWIADSGNHRVLIVDRDGALAQEIRLPREESGHAGDPTDVAVSPDGAFAWIADNDNHRLLRFETAGGAWKSVGSAGESLGQFQYPFQVVRNAAGDLFVSDVLNGRVQWLNAAGAPLRSVGGYGVELGQFFRPGGLALDAAGNLWVADSVLGVVQTFDPEGALIDVLRDESGGVLRLAGPLGLAFDRDGALYVVESAAGRVQKLKVTRSARPPTAPLPRAPGRSTTPPQPKACTVCHIEWIAPFNEGRDSTLAPRPVVRPDDPVVARAELCLSCHDGSVADSRLRVWDEHGHRTGVTPPATMQVPAHLPLVDGKLACRTCHSAHGADVPQGDVRRAVLLRVPNRAGELCMSCHADKTRGPRFGTHPTGGMPWPVPDELIAAGARVGPNPRELTCQVCHTPHGARHDHLLVMGTSSNQLCVTCHDQMRPGMFREGGPAEHPLRPLVNAEQAAAIRAMGTALGAEDRLVCLSCHRLHHGKGERFLLADDLAEGQMCLRCHSQRRDMIGTSHDLRTNFPQERNRLGMTVERGGPCSSCHLFHRFARTMTPGPEDPRSQCTTCHQQGQCAQNKRLGSVNHPAVQCTECHNPHEPRFGNFLISRPEDLCTRCHVEQSLVFGGSHDPHRDANAWCPSGPAAGDRCLACHRPHGDERYGLMRVAPAVGQAAHDAACIACHPSTAPDGGGALALLHPRATAGDEAAGLPLVRGDDGAAQIGCITCHNPHSGPSPGGLMLRGGDVASGIGVCVACHSDMRQIVLTAHSPEAFKSHRPESIACGPCHRPHGDAARVASRLLWPNDLLGHSAAASQPSGGAETVAGAHCVGCHRVDGPARPPSIATHPAVAMFNSGEAAGIGLPLYDAEGQVADHGSLSCGTCHLPHGRPMPDVPLDAVRTPETRAQRIQLRPFEPPNTCTNCHGADALRRFLYFHDEARRGEAALSGATPAGGLTTR